MTAAEIMAEKMIPVYISLVQKGLRSIEQVPEGIRSQVEQALTIA